GIFRFVSSVSGARFALHPVDQSVGTIAPVYENLVADGESRSGESVPPHLFHDSLRSTVGPDSAGTVIVCPCVDGGSAATDASPKYRPGGTGNPVYRAGISPAGFGTGGGGPGSG